MKSPWSTRLLWLFVAFISGIAWLSPAFGVPLVVSRQPAILNTCDYDGGSRMNAGYDGRHLFPAFHYGSAAVRISDREANQTAGTSGLFDKSTDFVAAEGTTALSPYRMTTAGETFSHYGYADSAASFEGGLRPGGFATSSGDLSGAEAQSGLALPRPTAPPNAVYTVTPQPGTWIRANPVAEPLFGQPGGLPEFQFPGGTGPGTVFGPMPIPPR